MAILDDILLKNKNSGANSFLPVNDNSLDSTDNPPEPNVKNEAESGNTAPQLPATPEMKYPNKPSALNDSEYEHLLKFSTPEAISKAYAPFDPEKGDNLFERYYSMTASKPTPPDEKKMRNKRLIADIADGAGMLAQLISASSGAYMRERNDSTSAKVKQVQDLDKNKYLQLSQRYNDGMYQARLRDFQRNLDDYNANRKGLEGALTAKNKLDAATAQAQGKLAYDYEKLRQDQVNKDKDFDLKKRNIDSLDRHRKAMAAQGWSRTSAYVKKVNNGNSKDSKYQMIFAANPNDNDNVRVDQFGNRVKVFDMTKGEIDKYAREALSNADFMNEHPELVTQKPDILGNGNYKYKPNQDIAAAYIMNNYNNGFVSDTNSSNPYYANTAVGTPTWGQLVWAPQTQTTYNRYDVTSDQAINDEAESEDDEFEIVGNINF